MKRVLSETTIDVTSSHTFDGTTVGSLTCEVFPPEVMIQILRYFVIYKFYSVAKNDYSQVLCGQYPDTDLLNFLGGLHVISKTTSTYMESIYQG